MKTVVLIGYGNIARLYRKYFESQTDICQIIAVDPNPHQLDSSNNQAGISHSRSLRALWKTLALRENIFVLSCPPDFHLSYIQEIIDLKLEGLVVMEKPVARPGQSGILRSLLATASPKLQFAVNDTLRYSPIACAFGNVLGHFSCLPGDKVRRMEIEFTKDRLADESKGRFIDQDFGLLGYEVFHMLSIASQMLPGFKNMVLNPSNIKIQKTTHHQMEIDICHESLPPIRFMTSMDGDILSQDRARLSKLFSDRATHKLIATGRLQGTSERFKVASAEMVSGSRADLIFEASTDDKGHRLKNHHRIFINGQPYLDYQGNHFFYGLDQIIKDPTVRSAGLAESFNHQNTLETLLAVLTLKGGQIDRPA